MVSPILFFSFLQNSLKSAGQASSSNTLPFREVVPKLGRETPLKIRLVAQT